MVEAERRMIGTALGLGIASDWFNREGESMRNFLGGH